MGFFVGLFIWILIPGVLIGLPAAIALLGLEKSPLVKASAELSPDDLRRAEVFWQRYDPRQMKAGETTSVIADKAELNAAIAAVLSKTKEFRGRVDVGRSGLVVATTAELPKSFRFVGRFVNIRSTFVPSAKGLNVSQLQIGQLSVPAGLAVPVLQIVIESLVGGGKGEEVIDSIRAIAVEGTQVSIAYHPSKRLSKGIKVATRKIAGPNDPKRIRLYYNKLVELARRQGSTTRTSLTAFIQPLFRLAANRSQTQDPVQENRAAILALSLYFGDGRTERVLNNVLSTQPQERQLQIGHVRLDGRHDYVQHFVVSAGLTLLAGEGIANAIGKAKEVEDTTASGFSFTDLAADRAGMRFAKHAVASKSEALRLQRILSGFITERDIFPPVRDLPEGLTTEQFQAMYGDTTSPAFYAVVTEIDRRIEGIPLYR